MFKWLAFWTKPRDPNSLRYRRAAAKALDGSKLKYVTERDADDNDTVVGKEGAIIVRDGELLIFSSREVVFRARVDDIRTSELLSGEGVIITAPDLVTGMAERSVIAYYTYYRK